jgi:hypothetical protein
MCRCGCRGVHGNSRRQQPHHLLHPMPCVPLPLQVLKVDDLSMVKVVQAPPDLLLSLSQ